MSLRRINSSPISPLLAFPLAWAFAALLCQLRVLNTQGAWSTTMVEVVVAVPLAFLAGGVIGEAIATLGTRQSGTKSELRVSGRGFRIALAVLVAIGLLELGHQFAKAGTIPILSGSIDAARFGQGGPTILLTDLLTVAAIAALVKPRHLFSRESRFELLVAVIAIGAFGLQAGRGSVVLPVIVAIVARWLYWGRPNAYVLTTGGAIAFVAIVAGFYLRTEQHPTTPFEAELFSQVLPSLPFFLKPLIPIYIALTTNFLALQGIVGHFPTVAPHGQWIYDAVALDDFVSGTRNVSDVSGSLTPPWVTSTVAGSFWADGGFAMLIPGVALTGVLSAGAYAAAVRTHSLRWAMVAAYLFFVALFGLYTNLWTQHLDWLVVSPLLLVLGAFAEDPQEPPGVVGRAWGKIRRMSGREPGSPAPEGGKGTTEGMRSAGRRVGPAIVVSSAALALLFAVGLVVQATLPSPYPLSATIRLPADVADAQQVMTDGDRPFDNAGLWWVNRRGNEVSLHYFDPAHPREPAQLIDRFRQTGAAESSFDITRWPPLRSPALVSLRQQGQSLGITVRRTDGKGVYKRFVSPIPPPPPGTTRDLAIATFSNRIPDLFVVNRNVPHNRVRVGVISGESGFRRQLISPSLPFSGLAPADWSLDIGSIAGRAPNDINEPEAIRSDIALVEHDPNQSLANLKVMLGEDGYNGFAFQRDLETPATVSRGTSFLIGARDGAGSIYEVEPHATAGPLLRIFGLEPPAGHL
jgi:hypothetical protein